MNGLRWVLNPHLYIDMGSMEVCNPLGQSFIKPKFRIGVPDLYVALRGRSICVKRSDHLDVIRFASDFLVNIL